MGILCFFKHDFTSVGLTTTNTVTVVTVKKMKPYKTKTKKKKTRTAVFLSLQSSVLVSPVVSV